MVIDEGAVNYDIEIIDSSGVVSFVLDHADLEGTLVAIVAVQSLTIGEAENISFTLDGVPIAPIFSSNAELVYGSGSADLAQSFVFAIPYSGVARTLEVDVGAITGGNVAADVASALFSGVRPSDVDLSYQQATPVPELDVDIYNATLSSIAPEDGLALIIPFYISFGIGDEPEIDPDTSEGDANVNVPGFGDIGDNKSRIWVVDPGAGSASAVVSATRLFAVFRASLRPLSTPASPVTVLGVGISSSIEELLRD